MPALTELRLPSRPVKRWYSFLFVVVVVVLAWQYDYPHVQTFGPASLHSWRQADGAAMTLRYHLDPDAAFFHPRTFFLANGNDGEAVAEFPLLYYLGGKLYDLFGPRDALLRWLHFLVFISGLYAFGRVLLGVLDQVFYALLAPLLLFTSPLLAFYGFAFLPNPVAVGLVGWAWWAYYRWFRTRRVGWVYGSALCFTLAGLIKVTLLVPFFAGVGVWLLHFLRTDLRAYFPKPKHVLAATALVVLSCAAWFSWVQFYNELHRSPLFLANIAPVWKMSAADIDYTWNYIYDYNHKRYWLVWTQRLFLVLLVVNLVFSKQLPRWFNALLWLTFLGSLAYVLLFFRQFLVHSYYLIDLAPLVLLTLGGAAYLLTHYAPRVANFPLLLVGWLVFFNWNMVWAKKHLLYQYSPAGEVQYSNQSLFKTEQLRAYVADLGLDYTSARVVALHDQAPNYVPYYLGLRGYVPTFFPEVKPHHLEHWREAGATHLVVAKPEYLEREDLQPFFRDTLGVFDESIYFFRL